MLKERYQELIKVGETLGVPQAQWKEENGKLVLHGSIPYQMQKDMLWDKIKAYTTWEKEVNADVKVQNTDIYGVYTVASGDTLSKISQKYLGNPNSYMKIFDINKDVLKDPDKIQVGQKLKIPNK